MTYRLFENNTASNVGTGGVGIFKSKNASDLEFKKLNAGSSKISVTDDTGNDEVDIDVVEANLTLDSVGGTLGISKGGSGQTTKTDAFDALAPTTTKGDVIVHNGTDNVRVAVGSDDEVLIADSGEASGVKWAAISSVFGSHYQYVKVVSGTWTTSTSYTQKATMTTGSLPSGNYRIGWSYEWNQESKDRQFKARIQVNNSTTVMEVITESKEVSGMKQRGSGFEILESFSGVATIDLDYATSDDDDASYISDVVMEIYRVS